MKVSIVTVGYNCALTLERTMNSVLQQTYQHIEYIVVDGGSTDDTINIIQRYKPQFKGRLHWVSEKDNGIYNAMNKGIKMATGNIVGILNSDDFLTTNHVIERMVAEFEKDDTLDLIYGDVHFVNPGNLEKNVRNYTGRFFKSWMIRFGYFPPHPSIYVKRETYFKHGFYNEDMKISADFELFANLVHCHHVSTRYLRMDFVTMLTGGESTKSWKHRKLGTQEDMIACRKLGIKTNWLFIHIKYIFKILDAVIPKRY
ncbi:MAG: glycosyltransferase [Prevotella sp.]|nr:glycosyltransferase [Prevotella sp.]